MPSSLAPAFEEGGVCTVQGHSFGCALRWPTCNPGRGAVLPPSLAPTYEEGNFCAVLGPWVWLCAEMANSQSGGGRALLCRQAWHRQTSTGDFAVCRGPGFGAQRWPTWNPGGPVAPCTSIQGRGTLALYRGPGYGEMAGLHMSRVIWRRDNWEGLGSTIRQWSVVLARQGRTCNKSAMWRVSHLSVFCCCSCREWFEHCCKVVLL